MAHILIIDDEPNVASGLALLLQRHNYQTTIVHTGSEALKAIDSEIQFNLVLLDLDLGDDLVNGFVVCQKIRARSDYLPIIMLTVYDSFDDKVRGLELGADDYVTKPYHERELVARIQANLRTVTAIGKSQEGALLNIDDDLKIDPVRRQVFKADRQIELTRRQFDLLFFLATNAGRPWGRQTLLNRVWGEDYFGVDRTVDKHISELRHRLEDNPDDPQYILTEYGFGYRFREW